jgi:prevent-host-death family protein
MALQVSVGQVKRNLAELINKVAYGGERIVVTSRGKPKAVLISVSDYEQLTAQRTARFAVIREIQDAAPDLPLKQVEKEVADTVKIERGKNATGHR